jgi:hypothetical protein
MTDNIEKIPKDLLYRDAAIEQMKFFRDRIAVAFAPRGENEYKIRRNFCKIAGWHKSKSVDLPVYYFNTDVIEVIARENFHNWNVTVIAGQDLVVPEYFQIDSGESYLFFEGMESYRRGPYRDNHREFSFCVWSDYELYSIMRCIQSQVVPTLSTGQPTKT